LLECLVGEGRGELGRDPAVAASQSAIHLVDVERGQRSKFAATARRIAALETRVGGHGIIIHRPVSIESEK
jgi:hypothetical protein